MNLRKATVFVLSLALTAGLVASVCQAQAEREREERERAAKAEKERAEKDREKAPQLETHILDRLRQLEKERVDLDKALDRIRQAERELRARLEAERGREGERPRDEAARPVRPAEREREAARPPEREREAVRVTEEQLRQRRLEELAEQSRQLRREVEAAQRPRPRPDEREEGAREGEDRIKVTIEGREVRPGEGRVPPVVVQRGPGGFGPGPVMMQPRPGGPAAPPAPGAPRGPAVGPQPPHAAPPPDLQQLRQMMETLHAYAGACFNPEMAAMIAIGGIKDDLQRKPIAAIRVLESSLREVRTPGLRTAIHMTLKDLYKAQGNDEMVIEHLRAILLENDEAAWRGRAAAMRGPGREGPRHDMKGGKDKDRDDDDEDEKDDD